MSRFRRVSKLWLLTLLLLSLAVVTGKAVFPQNTLAYVGNGEFNRDIFLLDVRTTITRNLTSRVTDTSTITSPLGDEFAYWWETTQQRVILVSDDDAHVRHGQRIDATDVQPAWSPDGRWLAFVSHRDGKAEIYVANMSSGALRNLSNHWEADTMPIFSPDSQWIAFVSNRDSNDEIYIVNLEGTVLYNLTQHPAGDSEPVWSPDGTQIAFVSNRAGRHNIYIAQLQSRHVSNPIAQDGRSIEPAWR